MKKLAIALLLMAVVAVPSAQAGIVTGDIVTVTTSLGTVQGYDIQGGPYYVDGPLANDFWTFCLELDESFDFNVPYTAVVSDSAMYGGNNTDSGDPLDERTAYLYAKFLANGWGVLTQDQLDGLQMAIWFLENEFYTYPDWGVPGAEAPMNAFLAEANGILPPGDYSGIRVMQLWDCSATGAPCVPKQDMLVNVPDGGTTLMLLGGALMGIGALRRKVRW